VLLTAGVMLLTGAVDTTVVLWELQLHKNVIQPQALYSLRGHVRELTAVCSAFFLVMNAPKCAASGRAIPDAVPCVCVRRWLCRQSWHLRHQVQQMAVCCCTRAIMARLCGVSHTLTSSP
jgi:hypothetical protein